MNTASSLLPRMITRGRDFEFLNAVKYNKKLLPAWQGLAEVDEQTHSWSALAPVLRNIIDLDPNDIASRIKLGRLLLVSGNLKDALQLVNEVKSDDSQNADLLALKAAILFKLKDSAGAVQNAQAALKIDPNNTSAMFVLAGNDFANGDTKGALSLLNDPAMSKSTDIGADLFKLRIFEKTQDLQQAEALLQKLIARYPNEASFKKELISLYLFQRRNDDAVKVQQAIVAANPKDTQAQLDLVSLLNATQGHAAAQHQLTGLISGGGDVFAYQIALAQLNFAQGDSAGATALLKKLINDSSSPDHVTTAQVTLATMYLRQKQIDEADALVADVLKKDGRNIAGLKLRAAIRMDRDQLDGAISDLRQALNDQPREVDLMSMLAVAYERSGSIDLAGKEFADAMQVSNFNPGVGLDYVAFLRRRGSLDQAEDVLNDLASRWPKNIAVLSTLAQVKLAHQDWAGAEEIAKRIKTLSTNQATADELLGAALAGGSKYNESMAAFEDAYKSDPSDPGPMAALVRAYVSGGKTDQAISFLQSVLKANPGNAQALILLGSLQLANKAPDQARQSFTTAIEKSPQNVMGYQALANYYISQKDYGNATKTLQAGLKQQPDSFALQLSSAGIAEVTGDYDTAISDYRALLEKNPGSIVVMNNLASLLADHRTDKASLDQAETLAQALQRSPVPQFKDTLGWVKYREADPKAALPLLESAATALPGVALVHYHLGMTYIATGQPEKAREQFKVALDHLTDHDLEAKIQAAQAKVNTQ